MYIIIVLLVWYFCLDAYTNMKVILACERDMKGLYEEFHRARMETMSKWFTLREEQRAAGVSVVKFRYSSIRSVGIDNTVCK